MKELSIKEKVKAYDEALKRAIAAHKDEDRHLKAALERIFPELKESEDEKIRKELYDFCIKCSHGSTVVNSQDDFAAWATWLEQHGFQKPTDEDMKEALRTEYEKGRADAIAEIQNPVDCIDCTNSKGCINCEDGNMKETLVQKTAWSEEDERIYKSITYSFVHNYPLTIQQQEFVKSLKPQNTWKPSEKQMEALKNAIHIKPYENPSDSLLWGLYEQLKTLKEY